MVDMLRESPLPWTMDMLRAYGLYGGTLEAMQMRLLIWRCARGLYTSMDRKPLIVIVTDEMLNQRFGFNL